MATLADLPRGASATLGAAEGADEVLIRLLELGLTPGRRVTVTRRAPLGGPIEINVLDTRVCLRRVDAARFPVSS